MKSGLTHKKVKAGALTYAIFLLLITVLIIGTLFTVAFYNRAYIDSQIGQRNLPLHVESLLTAATFDSTVSFPWNGQNLKLTTNPNYAFEVSSKNWGGYRILTALASYHKFNYEKKVLCGASGVLANNIALYLSDNNNTISVSGNTEILGDCFLPKSDIKASYMEGNYYRGKELVYGDVYDSESKLPKINSAYINQVKDWLNIKLEATDSIVYFSDLESVYLNHSFYKKTLYILADQQIYLSNCSFEGNIVFISTQPITIFSSALLSDIIVVAPSITFKKEFTGTLQAYAKDTLIAEYKTHLQFPSCIGVLSDTNQSLIDLKPYTQIEGNVWLHKNTSITKNNNTCYMRDNTRIHGIVQIEGRVSIEGDVFGSLYTEKFFLKTLSSYYENHVYNVMINAYDRNPYYASVFLNNDRSARIIKTLEP